MPVFPSSFSHFLNFSSPLFGPIILVFGCGFSSVGWISGLSEMVLLQGAGSCPTHSTAYQPHIQLSMKEGWKDRSIIGWKERGKASEGQRMERWEDVVMEKGERGTLDRKKEQKLVWLKNGGMKQRSESARGLCGRKPGKWVSGCRGYSLLVFLFFFFFSLSCSPPVSLTIAFLVDSWASISLLSLSPSLFFHTQAADRRTGAMMDDALSESDNIFSQSLKQDQAVWDAGQRWPLSVFVRSNCCVQSPLSWPPYQLHGACANWSWPHGPASQNLHSGYATASGQHLTTFQPCDFSLFLFVTGRKTVLWDHKQQQSLHMKSSSPVRRFSLSVCKQIHKDFYKPLNNSYNNACIFIINKFTNISLILWTLSRWATW